MDKRERATIRRYVEALCRRSGLYYKAWLDAPADDKPVPLPEDPPNG